MQNPFRDFNLTEFKATVTENNAIINTMYDRAVKDSLFGRIMRLPLPTGSGKTYASSVLAVIFIVRKACGVVDNLSNHFIYITHVIHGCKDFREEIENRVLEYQKEGQLSEEQAGFVLSKICFIPGKQEILNELVANKSQYEPRKPSLISLFSDDADKEQSAVLQKFLTVIRNNTKDSIKDNQSAVEIYDKLRKCLIAYFKENDLEKLSVEQKDALSTMFPQFRLNLDSAWCLIMTTDRFLYPLSCIPDKKKGITRMHNLAQKKDNLYLIDEVDKQFSVIAKHLTKDADTYLLDLFIQIHNALQHTSISNEPKFEYLSENLVNVQHKFNELFYKLSLQNTLIFEKDLERDKPISFFSDFSEGSLTLLNKGAGYAIHTSENNLNLLTETSENGNLNDYIIEIDGLVFKEFRKFISNGANTCLKELGNKVDEVTYYDAVMACLAACNLSGPVANNIEQQLGLSGCTVLPKQQESKVTEGDEVAHKKNNYNDFFYYGCKIARFQGRMNPADDKVDFIHGRLRTTPTGYLIHLLQNNNALIGVSATSDCKSVVNNFNYDVIEDELGCASETNEPIELELSIEENERLSSYFQSRTNYQNIQFEVRKINTPLSSLELELDKEAKYAEKQIRKALVAIQQAVDSNAKVMLVFHNKGFEKDDFMKLTSSKLQKKVHFLKVDAKVLRDKTNEIQEAYDTASANDQLLAIITSYSSMAEGVNPQYQADINDESIIFTGQKDTCAIADKPKPIDIDAIYLAKPGHVAGFDEENVLHNAHLCATLYHSDILLTPSGESSRLEKMLKAIYTPDNELTKLYIKYCESDYHESVLRTIKQAIGRICRTRYKRKKVFIAYDETLQDILSDALIGDFDSLEYRKLVAHSKESPAVEQCDIEYFNNCSISYESVQELLDAIDDRHPRANKNWEELRRIVLQQPECDEEFPPSHFEYAYFKRPERNKVYSFNRTGEKQFRSFQWVDGQNDNPISPTIHQNSSPTPLVLLKHYPYLRDYFSQNGFAMGFAASTYVINAHIYQDIYLPALAEQIIKATLEREGIIIKPMPNEHFEVFDYVMEYKGKALFLDAKNWAHYNITSVAEATEGLQDKLDKTKYKLAIFVNLFGQYERSEEIPSDNYGVISGLFDRDDFKLLDKKINRVKQWIETYGNDIH